MPDSRKVAEMSDYWKKILPWSIQVEVVQGCTRRCGFCGIRGVPREKQLGTRAIDLALLRNVFEQLNAWMPNGIRVELNSHGEPTLHPEFYEVLHVIRRAMPKAYITLQTNCEPWFESAILSLKTMFGCGLNAAILNCYKKGYADFFRNNLPQYDMPFIDYFHQTGKGESYSSRHSLSKPYIFILDDLSEVNKGGQRGHLNNKMLHNSGGNSDERILRETYGVKLPALPLKAKCSKVFREIILGWDGTIPICCQDWNDVHVMGNVKSTPIRVLWQSPHWQAVRAILYRRGRDLLEPCRYCSDPTNRVGLLPDVEQFASLSMDQLVRVIEMEIDGF